MIINVSRSLVIANLAVLSWNSSVKSFLIAVSPQISQHRPRPVVIPLPIARRYATQLGTTRSVSGLLYQSREATSPHVQLFTKDGCTLCDKVKHVLDAIKDVHDHTLELVDITDSQNAEYWDRYKYDIPVLHVNGRYWAKHKITSTEAIEGITTARDGIFQSPPGEPNAARSERMRR